MAVYGKLDPHIVLYTFYCACTTHSRNVVKARSDEFARMENCRIACYLCTICRKVKSVTSVACDSVWLTREMCGLIPAEEMFACKYLFQSYVWYHGTHTV